MSCWLQKLFLSIFLLIALPLAAVRPEVPKVPVVPRTPSLADKSGYVFTGTVKAVEFERALTQSSVATVKVTFQVDQGIRGVQSGQVLTIREWAGLWQAGQRYRAGEHVALFLYPPSKLGLTSLVGGAMGRFPVDPSGRIVVGPGRRVVLPLRPGAPERSLVEPRELINALRHPEEK